MNDVLWHTEDVNPGSPLVARPNSGRLRRSWDTLASTHLSGCPVSPADRASSTSCESRCSRHLYPLCSVSSSAAEAARSLGRDVFASRLSAAQSTPQVILHAAGPTTAAPKPPAQPAAAAPGLTSHVTQPT